ncbi:MAG: hypothetical protein QM765_04680 [Myxococcales bacterium]
MSDHPKLTKGVAVLAIVAGLAVLAIEVPRAISGASTEIRIWGPIGLLAVVLGVWELVAKKAAP